MNNDKKATSSMELRRNAGISRTELASALGVSKGTIDVWEQGKREPQLPLWKFQLWANLCQCSLQELLAAFPPPQEHYLVNQLQTIYADMQQPISN
jgi:DNA-binding XRE family transcriptional regulator